MRRLELDSEAGLAGQQKKRTKMSEWETIHQAEFFFMETVENSLPGIYKRQRNSDLAHLFAGSFSLSATNER